MTEEIIIDVDNCPHKRDDECMEVPICNEYGDLMGYQSCEAQTLCPYRSQKKIERLEQENEKLRYKIQEVVQANDRIVAECAEIMKPKCETSMISELMKENKELKEYIKDLQIRKDRYYLQVLEYERQVNDWIRLESQGLQDLRRIINEIEK